MDDAILYASWPADRPRPTPEEFEAARARYRAEISQDIRAGIVDYSDWSSGLEYVMATSARFCWWRLFFPDEPLLLDIDSTTFVL